MDRKFVVYEKVACFRCSGSGTFHVGECWDCSGKGYHLEEVDLCEALSCVSLEKSGVIADGSSTIKV